MTETHISTPYKGYSIISEGHGFYCALDPDNNRIASGEGAYTMREAIDEHIRKVYSFYARNSNLSPLKAKAAHLLTNAQAEHIISVSASNADQR